MCPIASLPKMGQVFQTYVILVAIVLNCNIDLVKSISLQEELTVTYSEKVALNKFRDIVSSRLPHSYMKEDIYLIKWLRAQHFDLKRAEAQLMQNLKWRKENKMDTIHEENWDDMQEEYPYRLDGLDKQGQPVILGNVGQWDLRAAYMTGRAPRVLRFLDKIIDEATVKVRHLQSEGKNVTRFLFIENLDNFNIAQHVCPQCPGGFLKFLLSFENHYPGSCDQIILINVSPVFEVALQVARTTLSPESRASMRIFGKNRKEWEKYVQTYVDKNQITREFGGTRLS